MWLLIDDVRDLNTDAIARTPEAGQRLLASGPWACLCLDHDLGTAQTGLDVLHWAIGHDCLPQRVQLVTTNLTARSKMAAARVPPPENARMTRFSLSGLARCRTSKR